MKSLYWKAGGVGVKLVDYIPKVGFQWPWEQWSTQWENYDSVYRVLVFQAFIIPIGRNFPFLSPHFTHIKLLKQSRALGFGYFQSQESGLTKHMDQWRYQWSQGSWSWQLWPCIYVMQGNCLLRPSTWVVMCAVISGDLGHELCTGSDRSVSWMVILSYMLVGVWLNIVYFSLMTDVKECSDINFYIKIMKGHFFFLRWDLFSLSFLLCHTGLNSSWEQTPLWVKAGFQWAIRSPKTPKQTVKVLLSALWRTCWWNSLGYIWCTDIGRC